MSYKALYLKYRPQTFEEVAGQQAIVRTLKNALLNGKTAHAYLFSGPRGTGKTTMARLFAKALNCSEGIGHQCNHCSNCNEISDGNHPDVIEIDAASNNGVEQARDLIEKVKYAPLEGRFKVYIIDEVHMMSTGAFNALLKTLEEPPENVKFILCTTEPHKVLATILSRCQRFDFAKVGETDMKNKLVEILNSECVDYDESGIKQVISLADGGMRDALSILDQVIAYTGDSLKEKSVLELYGLASVDEKVDLLKSLANQDIGLVVKKCEDYLAGGIDIRRLVGDLIAILKDFIVYQKTGNISLLYALDENNASALLDYLDDKIALSMINVLVDAQNNFKNVNDVRSLFELTMLRLASINESKTNIIIEKQIKEEPVIATAEPATYETKTPIVEKQEEVKPKPSPAIEQTGRVAPPDFLFADENVEKKQEPEKPIQQRSTIDILDTSCVKIWNISNVGDRYELDDDQIVSVMVTANKEERVGLLKKWPLLDTLRDDPNLSPLASLLGNAAPFALCKEALILSCSFTSVKEKINIKVNQEPLSQLVCSLLGRKVFVYAMDRKNDQSRVMYHYHSLVSQGKLPNKNNVKIRLP